MAEELTRDELLEKMQELRGMVDELDRRYGREKELDNEIPRYKAALSPQLQDPNLIPKSILFRAIGAAIGTLIVMISFGGSNATGAAAILNVIISFLIIGVGFAIGCGIDISRRRKKINALVASNNQLVAYTEANRAGWEEHIHTLVTEKAANATEINPIEKKAGYWTIFLGLPEQYSSFSAIRTLTHYIETRRADSLKESINLYEDELRKNRQEQREVKHQQVMQRYARATYEEQVRAANAAEQAAYQVQAARAEQNIANEIGLYELDRIRESINKQ